MAAVSTGQMRALEAKAMQEGWTEETLMNLAGERLGRALAFHFPTPGTVIGYLGKGHNAGDTLIALRILRDEYGWKIHSREAYPIDQLAPLTRQKRDELGEDICLPSAPSMNHPGRPLLLLDGLLGIGAKGALRPPLLALADEMAAFRAKAGATVAAIDLPSGLDPDHGEITPGSVVADITFMIGAAKHALLLGSASSAIGRLALVPVEPLTTFETGEMALICPQTCDFGKATRSFDFHKGQAGRISIVAGSENYPGAAVMAATGALRGGGGLITLFVPYGIRDTVSMRCPPEIIVRGIHHFSEALDFPHDAIAIGCGLGSELNDDLTELIRHSHRPTVLDADALNHLAKNDALGLLQPHHLITPHPGEFARLAPELKEFTREDAARRFCEIHAVTLLLKGSRTLVTRRGQPLWVNATGSPGMATGGQGDLLAGVIAARLGSGMNSIEAASHSAWLCGRAAERALLLPHISEESLTPEDVSLHLGGAFKDWQALRR